MKSAVLSFLGGALLYTSALCAQPAITRLNCGACYWESVIVQNPMQRKEGAVLGANGILVTTKDGWETTKAESLDSLTTGDAEPYWCDPGATTLDGKLVLTGLTHEEGKPGTGALWISETQGMNGPFKQTELQPPEGPADYVVDAPKVMADSDPASPLHGSIYVAANAVWFPEREQSHTGIFTLRGGVLTKEYGPEVGVEQPPQSTAILDGNLYLARYDYDNLIISRSTDGGKSFSSSSIPTGGGFCFARIAKGSDTSWLLAPGPTIAADTIHHRLYVAWARPRACEPNPSFTNGSSARYHDILLSSSDDGVRWSDPVRVNADVEGDRGFVSLAVDNDGKVYAAWIDHRNNQWLPVYDVYFTRSNDYGKSFEPDMRINAFPIPNGRGGRDPGDYLNMISIGENFVFVLHPCTDGGPWQLPIDACVARVLKFNRSRAVRH